MGSFHPRKNNRPSATRASSLVFGIRGENAGSASLSSHGVWDASTPFLYVVRTMLLAQAARLHLGQRIP